MKMRKTELKMLYDSKDIYLGVVNYDENTNTNPLEHNEQEQHGNMEM